MTTTTNATTNTTTTTTTTAYDIRAIMLHAHAIRKATDQGDGIRPIWSMCLSMAWQHAKNAPINVIAKWQSMSITAQMSFVAASVRKVSKLIIGKSEEAAYAEYHESILWARLDQDRPHIEATAWSEILPMLTLDRLTTINARRAEKGLERIGLSIIIYGGAQKAVKAWHRAEKRHGVATARTITDKNGIEKSYIDTMVSSPKDNTETRALLTASLDAVMATRDDIDNTIIAMTVKGYTLRDIATMVGMSHVAISKRLAKIRDALKEGMASA